VPSTYNNGLLTEAQRDRVDVVLVSPRNPLNIGAAARAMANFGFRRLGVVDPFEAHWREARSAVGAESLLQEARVFPSLREAVADCTLVAGSGTRTHRKPDQETVLLPALQQRVDAEIERGGRVAIVFGPEKRGLTRDDLAFCHLLVEIPTDPRQPSMNLGQAVAVCLYELARVRSNELPIHHSDQIQTAASSGTLERFADVLEETMAASGYSPTIMQEANRHDLRVMLRRLSWMETDATRALGLFRRILWKLRNPGRG
jgi:TrmH family RNA methyltransferase